MKLSASMWLAWLVDVFTHIWCHCFQSYTENRHIVTLNFRIDWERSSTHLLELYSPFIFDGAQLLVLTYISNISCSIWLWAYTQHRAPSDVFYALLLLYICRVYAARTFVIYDLQYNMELHSYFNKPFHCLLLLVFAVFFSFRFLSCHETQRCNLLRRSQLSTQNLLADSKFLMQMQLLRRHRKKTSEHTTKTTARTQKSKQNAE